MVITEPAEASARLKAWVRNYISATCRACSTKLFLDSCRIFHKYAKIEQAKEMLCWPDDSQQKKGELNEDSTVIFIFICGSNRDNPWVGLQGTAEN